MIILRASIIGLLFAVLLSVANHLTAPEIINNKQAFSERKIAEIVDGRDFIATDEGYTIYESGKPYGYVISTNTPDGYNGNIDLIIAHDLDRRVLAVEVIDHRETPGLGDAIEHDWVNTFRGRQANTTVWHLSPEGDFDSITGATITSRAMVQAVAKAIRP